MLIDDAGRQVRPFQPPPVQPQPPRPAAPAGQRPAQGSGGPAAASRPQTPAWKQEVLDGNAVAQANSLMAEARVAQAQAEQARAAADAARRQADASREAAVQAQQIAKNTASKDDDKAAKGLWKQARIDEGKAVQAEARADLQESEAKVAASRLKDEQDGLAPDQPSRETRAAEADRKAAQGLVDLIDGPPKGQPDPLAVAGDKARKAARKGDWETWAEHAHEEIKLAGLRAAGRGLDPKQAMAEAEERIARRDLKDKSFQLKNDKGGVDYLSGKELVKSIGDAFDGVSLSQRVALVQHDLHVEAWQPLLKQEKEQSDKATGVIGLPPLPNLAATAGERDRQHEVAREEANDYQWWMGRSGLYFDEKDVPVGSMGLDRRLADLAVHQAEADHRGVAAAAAAAGDPLAQRPVNRDALAKADEALTRAQDGLQVQDDIAVANQRALEANDANAGLQSAKDQYETALASQEPPRTVTLRGRSGAETTQTIYPKGYDPTYWAAPGSELANRVIYDQDTGKYFYEAPISEFSRDRRTTRRELPPVVADYWRAHDKVHGREGAGAQPGTTALAQQAKDQADTSALWLAPQGEGGSRLDPSHWEQRAGEIEKRAAQAQTTLGGAFRSWEQPGAPAGSLATLGLAAQENQRAQAERTALHAVQAWRADPDNMALRDKAIDAIKVMDNVQGVPPEQMEGLKDGLERTKTELDRLKPKFDSGKATPKEKEAYARLDQQQRYYEGLIKQAEAGQVRDGALYANSQFSFGAHEVDVDGDVRVALRDSPGEVGPPLEGMMAGSDDYLADSYTHQAAEGANVRSNAAFGVDMQHLDVAPPVNAGELLDAAPRLFNGDRQLKDGTKINGADGSWELNTKVPLIVYKGRDGHVYLTGDRSAPGTRVSPGAEKQWLNLWESQAVKDNADKAAEGLLKEVDTYNNLSPQQKIVAPGPDGKLPAPTPEPGGVPAGPGLPFGVDSDDLAGRRDGLQDFLRHEGPGAAPLQMAELGAVNALLQVQQLQNDLINWGSAVRRGLEHDMGRGRELERQIADARTKALAACDRYSVLKDAGLAKEADQKASDARFDHAQWRNTHRNEVGTQKEWSSQTWKAREAAVQEQQQANVRATASTHSAAESARDELLATLPWEDRGNPAKEHQLFMASPQNAQVLARPLINESYLQFGKEPLQMNGRADVARLVAAAGLQGEQAKAVEQQVLADGGERARVTVLPVVYSTRDTGLVSTVLFRVENGRGGATYVDERGATYAAGSASDPNQRRRDFLENNGLPTFDCDLVMPEDDVPTLDALGNVKLIKDDARIEGDFEEVRREWHIDDIAVPAVSILGTALACTGVGTGLGLLMLGVASAYGVATSAASLVNKAQHGLSINPVTNREARLEVLGLLASATSLPGIGAAWRASRAVAAANKLAKNDKLPLASLISQDSERGAKAAGLQLRAETWSARGVTLGRPAGVTGWVASEEQYRYMAENWSDMSGAEKQQQVGQLALDLLASGVPKVTRVIQQGVQDWKQARAAAASPVPQQPLAQQAPPLQPPPVQQQAPIQQPVQQQPPVQQQQPAHAPTGAGRATGAAGPGPMQVLPARPAAAAGGDRAAYGQSQERPDRDSELVAVGRAEVADRGGRAERRRTRTIGAGRNAQAEARAEQGGATVARLADLSPEAAARLRDTLLAKVEHALALGENHEQGGTLSMHELIAAIRAEQAFGVRLRRSTDGGSDLVGPAQSWGDVSLKGPFLMKDSLLPLSPKDQNKAVQTVTRGVLKDHAADVHVVDLFGLSAEGAEAMQQALSAPDVVAALRRRGQRVVFLPHDMPADYAQRVSQLLRVLDRSAGTPVAGTSDAAAADPPGLALGRADVPGPDAEPGLPPVLPTRSTADAGGGGRTNSAPAQERPDGEPDSDSGGMTEVTDRAGRSGRRRARVIGTGRDPQAQARAAQEGAAAPGPRPDQTQDPFDFGPEEARLSLKQQERDDIGAGLRFASGDALVGQLAHDIEERYPGLVVGVNVPVHGEEVARDGQVTGEVLTDADILLRDGTVLQVKSGNANGLTGQLERNVKAFGEGELFDAGVVVIGYAPETRKPGMLRDAARKGLLATSDRELLMDIIAPAAGRAGMPLSAGRPDVAPQESDPTESVVRGASAGQAGEPLPTPPRGGPDGVAPPRQADWTLPGPDGLPLPLRERMLKEVLAAQGRLVGMQYVVHSSEWHPETGRLIDPRRAGVPARSTDGRAPSLHATLEEAMAVVRPQAGEALLIVAADGPLAGGDIPAARVVATLDTKGQPGSATLMKVNINARHAGEIRVKVPDDHMPGRPLIRQEDGRRIDLLNAPEGGTAMGLVLFPRRPADLRLMGAEHAELLPVPQGVYAVDAHGMDGALAAGNQLFGPAKIPALFGPAEVAALIAADPKFKGQEILFFNCLAGDGRVPFAQTVATLLKTRCYGATQSVRTVRSKHAHEMPDGTVGKPNLALGLVDAGSSYNSGLLKAPPGDELVDLPIVQINHQGQPVYMDLPVQGEPRFVGFSPGFLGRAGDDGRIVFESDAQRVHPLGPVPEPLLQAAQDGGAAVSPSPAPRPGDPGDDTPAVAVRMASGRDPARALSGPQPQPDPALVARLSADPVGAGEVFAVSGAEPWSLVQVPGQHGGVRTKRDNTFASFDEAARSAARMASEAGVQAWVYRIAADVDQRGALARRGRAQPSEVVGALRINTDGTVAEAASVTGGVPDLMPADLVQRIAAAEPDGHALAYISLSDPAEQLFAAGPHAGIDLGSVQPRISFDRARADAVAGASVDGSPTTIVRVVGDIDHLHRLLASGEPIPRDMIEWAVQVGRDGRPVGLVAENPGFNAGAPARPQAPAAPAAGAVVMVPLPDAKLKLVDPLIDAGFWVRSMVRKATGRPAVDPIAAGVTPRQGVASMIGMAPLNHSRTGDPHWHGLSGYPSHDYFDVVKWGRIFIDAGMIGTKSVFPIPQRGVGPAGGHVYYNDSDQRQAAAMGYQMLELDGVRLDLVTLRRIKAAEAELGDEIAQLSGNPGHRLFVPGISGGGGFQPGAAAYNRAYTILHPGEGYVIAEATMAKEGVNPSLGPQGVQPAHPEGLLRVGQMAQAHAMINQLAAGGQVDREGLTSLMSELSRSALDQDASERVALHAMEELGAAAEMIVNELGLPRHLADPLQLWHPGLGEVLHGMRETGQTGTIHNDGGAALLMRDGGYRFSTPDGRHALPLLAALLRDPAPVVVAHMMTGKFTGLSLSHLDLLEWVLDHPKFKHVSFDLSWNDLAQHIGMDPRIKHRVVELCVRYSTRFELGTDGIKPANLAHYMRHYHDMEDILRTIQRLDPEAYENITWRNHEQRLAVARQRTSEQAYAELTSGAWDSIVGQTSEEHQKGIADWIDGYARAHGGPPAGESRDSGATPQTRVDELTVGQLVDWTNAVEGGRAAEIITAGRRAVRGDTAQLRMHSTWETADANAELPPPGEAVLRDPAGQPHVNPQTGEPYTPQALQAADGARQLKLPEELRRQIMNDVDAMQARQNTEDAARQAMQSRILKAFHRWSAAAAVAGGTSVALLMQLPLSQLTKVAGAAFIARGAVSLWRTAYVQTIRVVHESMIERGRISPERVDALTGMIRRWAPSFVKDPDLRQERLAGLDQAADQFKANLIELNGRRPDTAGMEPAEAKAAQKDYAEKLIAEYSRFSDEINRAMGVTALTIEGSNTRTPLGNAASWTITGSFAAHLAYHINSAVITWKQGDMLGAATNATFVVADLAFLRYSAAESVGGLAGFNAAATPLARRIYNWVANPVVSVGNVLLTAQLATDTANAAMAHNPAQALAAGGATLAAGALTYATSYLSWQGAKGELHLGVREPRKVQIASAAAAMGLMALGAYLLLGEEDERQSLQPPPLGPGVPAAPFQPAEPKEPRPGLDPLPSRPVERFAPAEFVKAPGDADRLPAGWKVNVNALGLARPPLS